VNSYNSEDWETRLNSIKSISKYSNTVYAKNSLLLVLKATDDTHSEVRIEALKILKKSKAPAAEEKIGQIALSDENSNVRFFAFSALEVYGNIKNENIFFRGLDDSDWLVKEASLKGLMKIDDPGIQYKYLDTILKAIHDSNISIKLTAISNITIKDQLIYNELAEIINNKESGLSILKAALHKIAGYKLDKKTKKRVIELLTHRDKSIRLLSLQVLKQEELNPDL
jgi:HEAT repeat protein